MRSEVSLIVDHKKKWIGKIKFRNLNLKFPDTLSEPLT